MGNVRFAVTCKNEGYVNAGDRAGQLAEEWSRAMHGPGVSDFVAVGDVSIRAWSSTERMSSQQADMLTSELTAYRRILEPVLLKICRVWLRLNGFSDEVAIEWDEITMQDEVDHANAAYLTARAAALEKQGRAGAAQPEKEDLDERSD